MLFLIPIVGYFLISIFCIKIGKKKLDPWKKIYSILIFIVLVLFSYLPWYVSYKITELEVKESRTSNCDYDFKAKDNVLNYDYYIKYFNGDNYFYNVYKIDKVIKVSAYSLLCYNSSECCQTIQVKSYDLNFTEEHMNTIYEFFNDLFIDKEFKIIKIDYEKKGLTEYQITILDSIINNNESLLQ